MNTIADGMARDAALRERIDRELAEGVRLPQYTVPQRLALACRMLAANGHWRGGLAGQITARAEQPGTFWTLRFGEGADEAKASRLALINEDLEVLNGDFLANPANRFHIWVYRQRPDAQCIVHTHPPAVSALSMVGEELAVAHMDATPFFEQCAYLPEWPGLPIADNEGETIANALGSKHSILLAHHGLLTAGASIEHAAVLAVWLEQVADLQLRARAVGRIQPIRPERAAVARDFLLKPEIIGLTFAYFARNVLKHSPDCIE
jgi:L-fuculose-phosphate aldolase